MSHFRLQTALNVRGRLEKLHQKAMAEQVQIAQGMTDRSSLLKEESMMSQLQMDDSKREGFTINQVLMHTRYQERVGQQESLLQQQIESQQQLVERKRQDLAVASQKKRVLEILKERHEERAKKKRERLERMEVDEISQNMYRLSREKESF